MGRFSFAYVAMPIPGSKPHLSIEEQIALLQGRGSAIGATVNCEIFPDDNGLFAAYRCE
jgi:hypothetical protein